MNGSPRTLDWRTAALVATGACLVAGLVACFAVPYSSIHSHNRLADEIGIHVSQHAEKELGLSCDHYKRDIGTILGGGGSECDIGIELVCVGQYHNGDFDVPVFPDMPGFLVVVSRKGPNRLVLRSYLDSQEPGLDPRCW